MNEPNRSLRPCIIDNKQQGFFHRWEQKQQPVPAAASVSGAPAGQFAYILAVVELEDGSVIECFPHKIRFTDRQDSSDLPKKTSKAVCKKLPERWAPESEIEEACLWVTKSAKASKWPCGSNGEKACDALCKKCWEQWRAFMTERMIKMKLIDVKAIFTKIETINAVTVIRCKNCMFYVSGLCESSSVCQLEYPHREPDDYCSFGKLKEYKKMKNPTAVMCHNIAKYNRQQKEPEMPLLEAAEELNCFLLSLQHDNPVEYSGKTEQAISNAASIIRQIASGEYKPVVHGHIVWKLRHLGGYNYYKCCECGKEVEISHPVETEEPYCSECSALLATSFLNHCPRCGAIMDGKEEHPNEY